MDRRDWVDSLFRKHSKELFRYLRSFRLPEDETYDLVQSTFIKALDANPSRIKKPKAWLFKVGRNMAINTLKRERRMVNGDFQEPADESPGVLSDLLKNEDHARLWAAVEKLSEKDRELLRLQLANDFSYAEIGRILGKSNVAVRVAMHRVREKLKDIINEAISGGARLKGCLETKEL